MRNSVCLFSYCSNRLIATAVAAATALCPESSHRSPLSPITPRDPCIYSKHTSGVAAPQPRCRQLPRLAAVAPDLSTCLHPHNTRSPQQQQQQQAASSSCMHTCSSRKTGLKANEKRKDGKKRGRMINWLLLYTHATWCDDLARRQNRETEGGRGRGERGKKEENYPADSQIWQIADTTTEELADYNAVCLRKSRPEWRKRMSIRGLNQIMFFVFVGSTPWCLKAFQVICMC